VLPVIGVYVGKRLLSKKPRPSAETLPEVTHIRIPITSLIGINNGESTTQSQQPRIVLPEDKESEVQAINPEEENVNFVASIERGKFHKPDCRWAKNIKSENKLVIEDRSNALERGFLPCNSCNP
jgi:hypothetical protein